MTEHAGSRASRRFPPLGDLPWHAVLVPGAAVLNAWVNARIYPAAMGRALFVAVLLGLLMTGLFALITRRLIAGGLLATAVLVVLLSWTTAQVALIAGSILAGWQTAILAALLLALFGAATWIAVRASRRDPGLRRLNGAVNVLAVALAGTIVVHGMVVVTTQGMPGAAAQAAAPAGEAPLNVPDIYLVLLDGYPRADTLSSLFDYDNSAFIRALRLRGFTVAEHSRSSYSNTLGTLASMFSNSYPSDEALSTSDNAATLSGLISNGVVFRTLRQAGYRIETVPPPFVETRINTADKIKDAGGISEFEYQVLATTWLLDLIGVLSPTAIPAWQRDTITGAFQEGRELVDEPSAAPRFTFIHVPAPHDPIVLGQDGSLNVPANPRAAYNQTPDVLGMTPAELQRAYVDEIKYINEHSLALADQLLASPGSRPKVIVFFSDHGFRDWTIPIPEVPESDLQPRFGTLFAASTPSRSGLFSDNIADVDVLPLLLNAYLGTDLPRLPYHAYLSDDSHFFEVDPGA